MTVYPAYSVLVSRWKWSLLLVFLLLAFVIESVLTPSPVVEITSVILYLFVFYGALLLAHPPRSVHLVGVAILAIWFLLQIIDFNQNVDVINLLWVAVSSTLVAGALVLTFQQLFSHEMKDLDRLSGAVFGYFLMALAWAMLFMQIEISRSGAFSGIADDNNISQFIYFSLITITSLGYGDILPVRPITRILAGFEVAGGTLYIAIFIGRVVGRFK